MGSAVIITPAWVDDRGTLVPDWSAATTSVEFGWRFVPSTTPNFEMRDGGRQGTTEILRGIGPADTALNAHDRVQVSDLTYECDGEPARWPSITGHLAHVEVTLKRVMG